MELRLLRTEDLSGDDLAELRDLLLDAFQGSFSDDDWAHTLGGWHVVATDDALLAHAAVVERTLQLGARPFRAGYVEAVGTTPAKQGRGIGSKVMRRINRLLQEEYELGALSTGRHAFYEQLGWQRWRGPTFVRQGDHLIRTAHEDDGIMVLRYGPSADVIVTQSISCDSRSGDDW